MPEIKKVLVANRGEIAIRVFRTCRRIGIKTVAIYTHADRKAPHVRYADEAYCITDGPSDTSYLKKDRIIEIAKKTGAAIHPGYGFYAENADFRRACDEAGVIFIGPSAEHIEMMGSKTGARAVMAEAGVPTVPGTKNPIRDVEEAKKVAREIGYPIMLKAVYGGGGKGMRLVHKEEDFESSFRMASSEALNAFGNGDVYMEKFIVQPHHVEIQVLGDMHGNAIHLFDRECSIQRRHQKVIEEAPSPFISKETREKMCKVAAEAIRKIGYYSAGTLEFIVGADQNFYFLEMNTRLQVEHPITEMITGVDIVREMIFVAEGKPLSYKQEDISILGHAIECRVYAEDPSNNFAPSPGLLTVYQTPEGPNVRVESGAYQGYEIPLYYDPMIAKVCSFSKDRNGAIEHMKRILSEYMISGIKTSIPFHMAVLKNPTFLSGVYDTGFIENKFDMEELKRREHLDPTVAAIVASIKQLISEKISASRAVTRPDITESNWKRFGKMINLSKTV
ncbi:acetyl-CoA carboxylase biotin carboxylase subunit [Calditerrivibrio nitroreducens]|uniref:biotin carboxylase n=1 Tax=Calditerrivibrio nitroreducens (strain DSM 19672 / NBRC 101217 / Yu37-1) TaxID=768670 RepID=E4TFL0_CALNY|nr:acetyl-CoA carboxylase biotin carboxylase subunit [Calditerrivibrio nitroreducens]ADR18478.1 biotin carboxylase [Calditerrivibrio nitroreducens DSM 19672]